MYHVPQNVVQIKLCTTCTTNVVQNVVHIVVQTRAWGKFNTSIENMYHKMWYKQNYVPHVPQMWYKMWYKLGCMGKNQYLKSHNKALG